MSIINLNLPAGVVVKGALHSRYDVEDLDHSILEVDLPDGATVDVGWFPQFDPNGAFRIVVFRDYWNNQDGEPISAADPLEVKWVIEELARLHSPSPLRQMQSAREEYKPIPNRRMPSDRLVAAC